MRHEEIAALRLPTGGAGCPCIPTFNQRLERGAYSLPCPPLANFNART